MDDQSLRRFMPKTMDDVAGARAITAASVAEVKPLVPEMLRLMNHLNKPVAEEFCLFFERHGEHFVEEIATALSRETMTATAHLLLTRVLPAWPAARLAECVNPLKGLVTRPDAFDKDLIAIRLLARHELGDLDWLRTWLQFKLSRAHARTRLASEIASPLGVKADGDEAVEPDDRS